MSIIDKENAEEGAADVAIYTNRTLWTNRHKNIWLEVDTPGTFHLQAIPLPYTNIWLPSVGVSQMYRKKGLLNNSQGIRVDKARDLIASGAGCFTGYLHQSSPLLARQGRVTMPSVSEKTKMNVKALRIVDEKKSYVVTKDVMGGPTVLVNSDPDEHTGVITCQTNQTLAMKRGSVPSSILYASYQEALSYHSWDESTASILWMDPANCHKSNVAAALTCLWDHYLSNMGMARREAKEVMRRMGNWLQVRNDDVEFFIPMQYKCLFDYAKSLIDKIAMRMLDAGSLPLDVALSMSQEIVAEIGDPLVLIPCLSLLHRCRGDKPSSEEEQELRGFLSSPDIINSIHCQLLGSFMNGAWFMEARRFDPISVSGDNYTAPLPTYMSTSYEEGEWHSSDAWDIDLPTEGSIHVCILSVYWLCMKSFLEEKTHNSNLYSENIQPVDAFLENISNAVTGILPVLYTEVCNFPLNTVMGNNAILQFQKARGLVNSDDEFVNCLGLPMFCNQESNNLALHLTGGEIILMAPSELSKMVYPKHTFMDEKVCVWQMHLKRVTEAERSKKLRMLPMSMWCLPNTGESLLTILIAFYPSMFKECVSIFLKKLLEKDNSIHLDLLRPHFHEVSDDAKSGVPDNRFVTMVSGMLRIVDLLAEV